VAGRSQVRELVIKGGAFSVRGIKAAGIGTGHAPDGTSRVLSLRIVKAMIIASGRVGIGAAGPGEVVHLDIGGASGSQHFAIDCSATSGSCINGDHVRFRNVSFAGITNTSRFIDAEVSLDLHFVGVSGIYRMKSERDAFGSMPILHFGNINFTFNNSAELVISDTVADYALTLPGPTVKGIVLSLGRAGEYKVALNGRTMCHGRGDEAKFLVGDGESYFDSISVCKVDQAGAAGLSAGEIAVICVAVCLTAVGAVILVILCRSNREAARQNAQSLVDSAGVADFTETQTGQSHQSGIF
jgi:hypothetical protein